MSGSEQWVRTHEEPPRAGGGDFDPAAHQGEVGDPPRSQVGEAVEMADLTAVGHRGHSRGRV